MSFRRERWNHSEESDTGPPQQNQNKAVKGKSGEETDSASKAVCESMVSVTFRNLRLYSLRASQIFQSRRLTATSPYRLWRPGGIPAWDEAPNFASVSNTSSFPPKEANMESHSLHLLAATPSLGQGCTNQSFPASGYNGPEA